MDFVHNLKKNEKSGKTFLNEESPPIYETRHPPLPEARYGTSRAARSPHTVCRGERQVRAPYLEPPAKSTSIRHAPPSGRLPYPPPIKRGTVHSESVDNPFIGDHAPVCPRL